MHGGGSGYRSMTRFVPIPRGAFIVSMCSFLTVTTGALLSYSYRTANKELYSGLHIPLYGQSDFFFGGGGVCVCVGGGDLRNKTDP